MTTTRAAGSSATATGGTSGEATGHGWDRHIGLAGSPNFRDAGGYRCTAGSLARGKLYRSGHLASLSNADREKLQGLGLQLVLDLRRMDERKLEPSWLPEGVALHGADITPGSQGSAIYQDSTRLGGAQAMYEFMCGINREFVDSQTSTFRALFAQLLDSGAERVLFHCSAGKDRTGFAIAALQLALGVSRADVESDYLLSARYYLAAEQMPRVRKKYRVEHLSDADLEPMLTTNPAYLATAMAAMESAYGNADHYLRDGLGLGDVERSELRRRFVVGGE